MRGAAGGSRALLPDDEADRSPLESIHTLQDRLQAFALENQLGELEERCRARLRLRPHMLSERILLALCLSRARQDSVAVIEWDEAVYQAERLGDWEILEGCLLLMARHYPDEALSTLDHLSEAFAPITRAWLKANLLAELGREAEAERTVLQAISTPHRVQARPHGTRL